jgi:hypothetical protein
MQQIAVNSWEEFEEQLRAKQAVGRELLYRGQHNWEWKLKTTLDRIINRQVLITEYYALISDVRMHLESLTSQSWNIRDAKALASSLQDRGTRPNTRPSDSRANLNTATRSSSSSRISITAARLDKFALRRSVLRIPTSRRKNGKAGDLCSLNRRDLGRSWGEGRTADRAMGILCEDA